MQVTITHKGRDMKPGQSSRQMTLADSEALAAAHMVAAAVARAHPDAVLVCVSINIEADVLLDTEGNDATE